MYFVILVCCEAHLRLLKFVFFIPLVCSDAHQGFSIKMPLLYSIPPDKSTNYTDVLHIGAISVDRKVYSIPMTERQFNENNTIMEEQTTIILDKEQLLILCSAIIIAGIASNYSTVSPTSTHLLVAQGLAQSLLDSIQK